MLNYEVVESVGTGIPQHRPKLGVSFVVWPSSSLSLFIRTRAECGSHKAQKTHEQQELRKR